MARQDALGKAREIHSEDMPIDQRPIPEDLGDRDGDVILTDRAVANDDFVKELAFMDEAVTIRLEPSADRNAITVFPVWINGQGAEIFQNGRWQPICWLPVGQAITIKRKVLEVIARTKIDNIQTEIQNEEADRPHNTQHRFTSSVHAFSVLEDNSPRGHAWLTEVRRRNF